MSDPNPMSDSQWQTLAPEGGEPLVCSIVRQNRLTLLVPVFFLGTMLSLMLVAYPFSRMVDSPDKFMGLVGLVAVFGSIGTMIVYWTGPQGNLTLLGGQLRVERRWRSAKVLSLATGAEARLLQWSPPYGRGGQALTGHNEVSGYSIAGPLLELRTGGLELQVCAMEPELGHLFEYDATRAGEVEIEPAAFRQLVAQLGLRLPDSQP